MIAFAQKRSWLLAVTLISCFEMAGGAHAQTCPTPVGDNSKCTTPYFSTSPRYHYPDGSTPSAIGSDGFPLNLALWAGFGPPDLPPRSLDTVQGSLPMVSAERGHFRSLNPHAQRPTLNGLVDLVTGLPLYQEIDFSLDFGGATFRHVRTHSDSVNLQLLPTEQAVGPLERGMPDMVSWDWNGTHWMMGENPILLIDAAYPNVYDDVRMCYLIPDAHHTIPFQEIAEGRYEAPDWFDASLEIDPADPNEYVIWLGRRSVKYVFRAHWEDVPDLLVDAPADPLDPGQIDPNCPCACIDGTFDPNSDTCLVNAHASAAECGAGIPYYALLHSIEDRHGNRAEINYVAQTQWGRYELLRHVLSELQ